MSYKDDQFIIAQDLSFAGVLHDIKKSKIALQPIFECFTNALEAIKIKQKSDVDYKGEILLKINASETTLQSTELNSLSIEDNGIGFNEEEFKRFNTFKLTNKGFKNLGSGRIQFVHYFDRITVKSVFEQDGKFFEREFVVSKSDGFLKQNAIVKHKHCKEANASSTKTIVTFSTLLENSGVYHDLNQNSLKEKLLERYIHYFCYNKGKLPKIKIEFYVHSELKGESTISQIDIPDIDKKQNIPLRYSRKSNTRIEKTDKTEEFTINAFKLSKDLLKENRLNLVSKGEVIEESDVNLESLAGSDHIKGSKYLFLVSSNYIDARDTNLRGVLNIPNKDSFEKDLFANEEEILIEDIQEEVNKYINTMYPEIEKVKQKHQEDFAKLKEMFLLDDETAKNINISINDSESKILEKFYEAEAKKSATIDSKIKERIDRLEHLDTSSADYSEKLEQEISHLVREIPQVNKTALTHYVARRKLVLELFKKILDKKLLIQVAENRDKNEELLHNLIFQQTTSKSENSDLWLINEDFIYFNGSSEKFLKDVRINGNSLLKTTLTDEEEEFRVSLKENRFLKRPDILLFPDEGKCIIKEFKNPEVNVSEHLSQINNYATLIRNFSSTDFEFNTFYGYLIGEKISANDVRAYDADFIESYHFDYLFRADKKIAGMFGNRDANLYTEVIKYSTLLDRAKRRNEIFINKLTK